MPRPLSTKQSMAVLGGTALAAAAVAFAPMGQAGAAEQVFEACPASVSTFVDDNVTPYPPYSTPSSEDASALVGCAGSFVPSGEGSSTNVVAQFAFAGLPTNPCYVVTGLTVSTSGAPGTAGWPFLAYNVGTGAPITGPAGTGDGGYQQYNGAAGSLLPYLGLEVYSPIDQPAQGSYEVEYQLDPSQISLADLAAGQLGLTVNVINDPADLVESLRASVTVDDANCTPGTTVPTTATTTAPTTTAPPAVTPVVVTPKFTA